MRLPQHTGSSITAVRSGWIKRQSRRVLYPMLLFICPALCGVFMKLRDVRVNLFWGHTWDCACLKWPLVVVHLTQTLFTAVNWIDHLNDTLSQSPRSRLFASSPRRTEWVSLLQLNGVSFFFMLPCCSLMKAGPLFLPFGTLTSFVLNPIRHASYPTWNRAQSIMRNINSALRVDAAVSLRNGLLNVSCFIFW